MEMLRHTSVRDVIPEDKMFFTWGTPLNEPDRDPEFNVLSPVGRRQSVKSLRKLKLPRPTLDSDRLYRARSNEDVHHTIVYNKGPPGQTPFPTVVAMSGYFPPNQPPQQGFYPPPPQHQNSYPPPSQAPFYQAPAGYPGQAAPPSMQYSALGSTYAPAMYTPPASMPGYPPAAEAAKAAESLEEQRQQHPSPPPPPPAYVPSPYAIPEADEKDKERGFFSGFAAPAAAPGMPVPYPSGGMATATASSGGSISYPYPTTQPRPVNADEMFWILYHRRYNGNEKQTRELVTEEMARQSDGTQPAPAPPSFYYPQPSGSGSGNVGAVPPPTTIPAGSQQYPSHAAPAMYQEYHYEQQQQQQQQYQQQQYQQGQPPKKDVPDWMKLAGGVAAGGLAVAGTKKLFDMVTGDKKAHHHHH
ncbi:hypothetical protein DFQ26_006656 [Actinomortierella ambigua]|nr:hypothetical protein DFQ26_006656 [Actinomortierella ambigua]